MPRLDVNMVYCQRLGPMLLVDVRSLVEYHWRRVQLCKSVASIVTTGSSPSVMVVIYLELSARRVSFPYRLCELHGREATVVSC